MAAGSVRMNPQKASADIHSFVSAELQEMVIWKKSKMITMY